MSSPIQYSGPVISADVPWETRRHLQLIYQKLGNHTQAFSLQQQDIAKLKGGNSTTTIIEGGGGGSTPTSSTALQVNNQTGNTSYTTISGDANALILFSDASPIALTLSNQTPPWGCYISNIGASGSGAVTITPFSGTINGAATLVIPAGGACIVAFDGTNWYAALTGITQLTQDVLAGPGAGSQPATVVGIQTIPVDSIHPTDDQVLQYSAATAKWEPSTLPAIGNGTYFLDQAASDVASYETLINSFPSSAEFTYSASGTSGAGQVLVAQFVGPPGGMGFTILPAGMWTPSLYLAVDALTQGPEAIAKIYTRTAAGVETLQATLTIILTATAVTLYTPTIELANINVAPTDRMVVKVYLLAGGLSSRTLTLYVDGSTHASHVHFPASTVNRLSIGVLGATIQATDVNKPQYLTIPFNATITNWTIIGDVSGSASVDVWFVAGTAPPTAPSIPVVGNKISASAPIALSTAQSAAGGTTAVSTWTKALSQWGTLAFNLTSATTVAKVTVQIQVTRS